MRKIRLVLLLCLAIGAREAHTAELDIAFYSDFYGDGRSLIQVDINGALTGEEVKLLKREIDIAKRPVLSVKISSPGGSWHGAMELGHFLRKVGASVAVNGECYSSCVLVLAGGIHRQVLWGAVGIHRPFSTDVSSRTFAENQRRFNVLEAETKKYLNAMNMPASLFDAMISVPPEEIRKLSSEELKAFRLSQSDPVAQEGDDNDEARKYGVDKVEYLRRKARRATVCRDSPSPETVLPSTSDSRRRELIEAWVHCQESVMQGKR